MHNQNRNVHQPRQCDGAMGSLSFANCRMTDRVVPRFDMAAVEEPLTQPTDHVVVFSVDHDKCTMFPSGRQYVENLHVVEPQAIVRHVDLE